MGYDLSNDRGEEFRFSPSGWSLALEIAERAGWKPEGTLPPANRPADHDWSGDYFSNEGQRVSPSDAAALIRALELALSDPAFSTETKATFDDLQAQFLRLYPKYSPIEFTLSDAAEFGQRLRALIALARDGGFVID